MTEEDKYFTLLRNPLGSRFSLRAGVAVPRALEVALSVLAGT